MKKLQLGLIVEGNSTRSAILGLPKVCDELGPVKSAALRVARRISNLLRAGYAIEAYEELQAAKLVLMKIPDSSVDRTVSELCASELMLEDLSFVLCESWMATDCLEPLRQRGASVATLVEIPCRNRNWFAIEGQPIAVRLSRRVLEGAGAKVFELRSNTKSLLFTAELATLALPVPYFAAAQRALRASGIAGNHLTLVLEEFGLEMLRTFLKSNRKAWGWPRAALSDRAGDSPGRGGLSLAEQHTSDAV
jgi:hypothetical protein